MARALAVAERGRATVRPNPLVGCVILAGGAPVGEGWHGRPGGPHAEVTALQAAGGRARGATAVVTLEPCAHHGRTGPCADALAAAGVARVVFAVHDPHPHASGGARRLARAGVTVADGLMAPWAAVQNEVFLHVQRSHRPFVTLKLAQTFGGGLVAPAGRWITGPVARTAVHRLRSLVDGVVVGSGTVLADDPALTVRHVPAPGGQPRPVILDGRGRVPPGAVAVRSDSVVVTTGRADRAWRAAVAASGAQVVVVPPGPGGCGVALPDTLRALHHRGMHALLVEGGGQVAASFVAGGLADRVVLHVADGPGTFAVTAAARPRGATTGWVAEQVAPLGGDLELRLRPQGR